jgi:aminoglycoside phosphotransferase (APT) family kinase protein
MTLANPEAGWERREQLDQVSLAEVERCLGRRVDGPLRVLPGGLANTNVHVGDVVVRLHRRDPSIASLEAHLLARPWRSFRVPQVVSAGAGFLVLEYVAHGPIAGSAREGSAVGRALAEVHARRFEDFGDLEASGAAVREPFADLVGTLVRYARAELETRAVGLEFALRERVVRALAELAPRLRAVVGPPVLLHGDFKVSNLHWAADDRLLVLDWEFAYAGAALLDIGQLLRWHPPPPFKRAFAEAYRAGGGELVEGWERWSAAFDLVNLAGLLANLASPAGAASARVADLRGRIETTLALLA